MFDWIKRLLGLADCRGCVYRRFWGLCCGKRGGMLPHGAWQKFGCWHYAEDGEIEAMRRGLEKAESLLHKIHYLNRTPELDTEITECIEEIGIVLKQPPRNCDVGTAEEQNERYKLYCANHRDVDNGPGAHCMKCPLNDRKNSLVMCQFLWAQMPYEEGGAE